MSTSVMRRAASLLAFTMPAALLNLGFTYIASHLLSAEAFGIFYTTITVINILFTPAVIVNLFFSRYIAAARAADGAGGVRQSFAVVLGTVSRWLVWCSLAGLAVVAALGAAAGLFSPVLGALVIAVVATSYFGECGRIVLQGEHRFFRLGMYTLAWMGMRFLLGAAGLALTGSVWGGLAGVALSAPVAFVLFFGLSPLLTGRSEQATVTPPRLLGLAPFALGFGVFTAIAHADIIVAYLTLSAFDLGVYSGSSVLPKGVLIITLPIIQLAFPMMVGRRAGASPGLPVLLKGLAMTGAVSGGAAIMIALLSVPACTSPYGLAACDSSVMAITAFAMVPFCLLRFLISMDYAAESDWLPVTLAIPLAAFIGLSLTQGWTLQPLSVAFGIFSLILLGSYPLLGWAQGRVAAGRGGGRGHPNG